MLPHGDDQKQVKAEFLRQTPCCATALHGAAESNMIVLAACADGGQIVLASRQSETELEEVVRTMTFTGESANPITLTSRDDMFRCAACNMYNGPATCGTGHR